jgi:hypothetical protein
LRLRPPRTVAFLALLASLPGRAWAASAATETEVKAAFLCSFAEFVEWPSAAAGGAVTIGILGADPFGAMLEETVKTRTLQTRPLALRRLANVEEALTCQIVFVSASEKRRLPEIFRALAGTPVLTVSDIEGFARQGGVIGFVLEQRRVRFEINAAAAEKSGLRISSRLLNLARLVTDDRGGGA